jgi:superfamily II DNA or RNA helicase
VEQAVGRILRPHTGKKDPVIVDLRDDEVGMFKNMGKEREKFYDRVC